MNDIEKAGLRVMLGLDTAPRSYSEMVVLTAAAHRFLQRHEVTTRRVLGLLCAISVGLRSRG